MKRILRAEVTRCHSPGQQKKLREKILANGTSGEEGYVWLNLPREGNNSGLKVIYTGCEYILSDMNVFDLFQPYDEEYLAKVTPPIKFLSFHSYLRKLTGGVDK